MNELDCYQLQCMVKMKGLQTRLTSHPTYELA